METWKPIANYEGFYEVSDMGRVRSVDRVIKHPKGGDMIKKGHVLKQNLDTTGRFHVTLFKDGKGETRQVHKLVKNTFHGPTPEGLIVRHGKRRHKCNELSNLEFGTYSQNNGLDRKRDGTLLRGEKHPLAKLTETDVRSIRRLLKAGWPQKDIAKIFGVTRYAITDIKRGKSWSHLDR
jgi:hypothetical protein